MQTVTGFLQKKSCSRVIRYGQFRCLREVATVFRTLPKNSNSYLLLDLVDRSWMQSSDRWVREAGP
jgi:hypothetical protein